MDQQSPNQADRPGSKSGATLLVVGAIIVVLGGIGGYYVATSLAPEEPGPRISEGLCPDGPGNTYTVTIIPNEEAQPPFVVQPDPVGPAELCDVIVFVNKTGQPVTLDFNPAGGSGSPFFGESIVTLPGGEESASAMQVDVNPDKQTDYLYSVSVGGEERSPRIRIRPRPNN